MQRGAPTLQVSRGPLAEEAVQSFGPYVSQRVRLAKGSRHVEITYTVGPIPVADGAGKEVVSRFSTDLRNAGESCTDSNGREMLRRKRDFRASWKYNATDHGEPVSSNYYPVTTAIHIRDARAQLTVLNDRAQGGSGSVRDGELELMVHRRVLKDDNKGVGEPLNETEFTLPYGVQNVEGGGHRGPGLIVRGQHLVMVGPPRQAAAAWRPQMDRFFLPPAPFFASPGAALGVPEHSALQAALPANVQIVTLEPLAAGGFLLRLAHQFGLEEDEELSKPVSLDLAKVFAGRRIADVRELGLTGTITRAEVVRRRVAWNVEGEERDPAPAADDQALQPRSTKVTLGPLQIRTFHVTLAPTVSYV